jgi:hypothetical protein
MTWVRNKLSANTYDHSVEDFGHWKTIHATIDTNELMNQAVEGCVLTLLTCPLNLVGADSDTTIKVKLHSSVTK